MRAARSSWRGAPAQPDSRQRGASTNAAGSGRCARPRSSVDSSYGAELHRAARPDRDRRLGRRCGDPAPGRQRASRRPAGGRLRRAPPLPGQPQRPGQHPSEGGGAPVSRCCGWRDAAGGGDPGGAAGPPPGDRGRPCAALRGPAGERAPASRGRPVPLGRDGARRSRHRGDPVRYTRRWVGWPGTHQSAGRAGRRPGPEGGDVCGNAGQCAGQRGGRCRRHIGPCRGHAGGPRERH